MQALRDFEAVRWADAGTQLEQHTFEGFTPRAREQLGYFLLHFSENLEREA
jgi:hypothetical protein